MASLADQVAHLIAELREVRGAIERGTAESALLRKAIQASENRHLITNENTNRIARATEDVAAAQINLLTPMSQRLERLDQRFDTKEAIREASQSFATAQHTPAPDRAVTLVGMAANVPRDRFYAVVALLALALLVGGGVVVWYLVHGK